MKYFKLLNYVIVTFFVVISILLSILWFNLELVVTSKSLEYINKRYFSHWTLDWTKISIEIDQNRVTSKGIRIFSSEETCVENAELGKACFENIDLSVLLSLSFTDFVKLRKVRVVAREVELKEFISGDDKEDNQVPLVYKISENLETFSEIWKGTDRSSIEKIEIKQIKYLSENSPIEGQLKIDSDMIEMNAIFNDLKVRVEAPFIQKELPEIKVSLNLEKEVSLNLYVNLKRLDKKFLVTTSAQLDLLNKNFTKYLSSQSQFSLDFEIESNQTEAHLHSWKPEKSNFSLFSFERISITLNKVDDLFVKTKGFRLQPMGLIENSFVQRAKKELKFRNSFPVDFESTLGVGSLRPPYNREVSVKISTNTPGRESEKVQGNFSGVFQYNGNSLVWKKQNFDVAVDRIDFVNLNKILDMNGVSIPAPFNSYKGFGRLHIFKTDVDQLDFEWSVDLSGPEEMKAQLSGSTKARISPKTFTVLSLRNDILINQLNIYLPPFDPILGLPEYVSELDGRDRNKDDRPKSSGTNSIQVFLNVKTAKDSSIRFYYKHFNPYVEGGIKFFYSPNSWSLIFRTGSPFAIAYIKRKIVLKSLTFEKRENDDLGTIDLSSMYEASGYDIFIDVKGDIESPNIIFSSKPTLQKEDIISLLLYNRKKDKLSSFQSESVGGTETAIADRALGLFGLWALASTPIESIYYNPADKSYNAQIQLDKNLSFNIGTDWEKSRSLGLRRNLGDNWSIVTEYQSDSIEQFGNFFIQKEVRF